MTDAVSSGAADDPIRLYPPTPQTHMPLPTPMPALAAVVSGLVVVVVCAVFAVIVLSGRTGQTVRNEGGAAPAADVVGGSERRITAPVAPEPAPVAPLLLSPDMDYAQMAASLSTDPAALCADLTQSGFPATPWQRGPVNANAWECSSIDDAGGVEDIAQAPRQSTMFFMFRGSEQSRVTSLRVKLNLLDPAQDEQVIAEAGRFLSKLGDHPDLALPQTILDAVSQQRPAAVAGDRATIRFHREAGAERRFNLTVDYRPTAKGGKQADAQSVDPNRWSGRQGGPAHSVLPQAATGRTPVAEPTAYTSSTQKDRAAPTAQPPGFPAP